MGLLWPTVPMSERWSCRAGCGVIYGRPSRIKIRIGPAFSEFKFRVPPPRTGDVAANVIWLDPPALQCRAKLGLWGAGLANGHFFPKFGELWFWGLAMSCGNMHQSVAGALVVISYASLSYVNIFCCLTLGIMQEIFDFVWRYNCFYVDRWCKVSS